MKNLDCISEENLTQAFRSPPPGIEAWKRLMPFKHPLSHEFSLEGLRPSAVLIALYRHENRWMIPLILRTDDGYHHSGQVSFPGGRKEENETAKDCALREAFEEIGITKDGLKIIGELTPIPIHVSNFLVYPFVAILKQKPNWVIQPDEVAEVLEIGLSEFCEESIRIEEWDFPHRGGMCPVPFYYLREKKIWGATAMMLSELTAVLEKIN